MNSRLERLRATIAKCEKVDRTFVRNHIRGQEPTCYDDILAGFTASPRNGFRLAWHLVFEKPRVRASKNDSRDNEPTYVEVKLSGESDTGLFEVNYFPAENIWGVEASTQVGNDGTEATRNLAADFQIDAGDFRRIGEDEALRIITTLCAFYASQPIGG